MSQPKFSLPKLSPPGFSRNWRKPVVLGLCVALTPVLLAAGALLAFQGQADASSHREAPAISKDAYADTTDVYTFISPENSDNIVLAASWIPFEGPEGGPNYYEWDANALYDIFVDTDGDALPNVTYTLSSRVETIHPDTFLYNTNTIDNLADGDWNRPQFITVTETTANGVVTNLVANKRTSPVNIGSKSTPNYADLESEAIYEAAGGSVKVFAGQTDDPFWVDLQVFDLLTLRGQDAPIGYAKGNNVPVDSLSGFNVHSLVIELPITRIKKSDAVFGVWAGTRRPSSRVLLGPGGLGAQTNTGDYVQVSRLGMPLVNEVVVPLALKDAFNSIPPSADLGIYTDGLGEDVGALFQKSVEDPEVGRLLCGLYGVPLPGDSNDDCSTEVDVEAPRSGRGDIFDIYLKGMVLANPFTITTASGAMELPAGFTITRPSGVQPAEMLRINTGIKGNLCDPHPNRLGILGGDACGFPNGRRLTDDVIDISLLAVSGAAYGVLDGRDASFSFNPALIGVLDDHLNGNDVSFRSTFPYMAHAQSGQEHIHQNPFLSLMLPFLHKAALIVGDLPGGRPMAAGATSLAFATLLAPAVVLMRRRKQGQKDTTTLDE
jgi:hypothetical protein